MSADPYRDYFSRATGGRQPFAYQTRLACGDDLAGAAECRSLLIDVPTGCGKTAAVVLAWLWNRVQLKRGGWPRRLVYCLPMRTLVEQTRDSVRGWLDNLHKLEWNGSGSHTDKVGLHILMGGEEDKDWDIYPEEDAILIGTQDMLLSRALNRGYGMSRYRWPMAFGLLNNDCLWVMDETQLMGVGVETSAQMDGFRATLGTVRPTACWWMSATLEAARLGTVNHPEPAAGWPRATLPEADQIGPVRQRWQSHKILSRVEAIRLVGTGGPETTRYAWELAQFIREKHVAETLTLVVVNRVARAQALYELLDKTRPSGASVALIHSRFRRPDRASHERTLFDLGEKNPAGWTANRIVIATQAVEAGVDVSARTLITELAPWSSLVQRFGRCNRYGEHNDTGGADIFWVDLAPNDDKDAAPYTAAELKIARDLLVGRHLAGPRELAGVRAEEPRIIRPVLRRKDLLDLFDTTPDLCGNDLDISRYVREGDDTDAQVFWRNLGEEDPPKDTPRPKTAELCRVSVGALATFAKSKPRAFVWNSLDGRWERLGRVRPGLVILLDSASGGYVPSLGWTGQPGDQPISAPEAPPIGAPGEEPYGGDPTSIGPWVTLADHTSDVVKELDTLLGPLGLDNALAQDLRTAAIWHDVGKAHEVFQAMLTRGDDVPEERRSELQAKSNRFRGPASRPGFRHELASSLAWLKNTAAGSAGMNRDLIAYIIAAHHGKVRLSIRSLPDEKGPRDSPTRLFARGVWDGEWLPGGDFREIRVDHLVLHRFQIDLGYMQMGEDDEPDGRGPSWLARTLALRDDATLGPFRLAYLETLLRVADWRASGKETPPSMLVNPA